MNNVRQRKTFHYFEAWPFNFPQTRANYPWHPEGACLSIGQSTRPMDTLCMITLIQETEINSPTRTPNCAAERSPKDVLLCLALCERLVSVQAVITNCRKFHDELRKQKCRAEKRENKHR